jgi:hypothetical protein
MSISHRPDRVLMFITSTSHENVLSHVVTNCGCLEIRQHIVQTNIRIVNDKYAVFLNCKCSLLILLEHSLKTT